MLSLQPVRQIRFPRSASLRAASGAQAIGFCVLLIHRNELTAVRLLLPYCFALLSTRVDRPWHLIHPN